MLLHEIIEKAYLEDLPAGDITTDNLNIDNRPGKAELIAKEDLVLSGVEAFTSCLEFVCKSFKCKWYFKDGDFILKGQTVCLIETDLIKLLKAERVALNFIGRMSGIATITKCFAEKLEGTDCKVLDTRKTTPLLRDLEKLAVQHGGGNNHRRDLSSQVMLKENHIFISGGIRSAIETIRKNISTAIIVETQNLTEVEQAVSAGANRILLDNMDNETMVKALEIIPSSIETEASGNMSLERVASVAQLGVHFISVGALTHSAPTADFSLLFDWDERS